MIKLRNDNQQLTQTLEKATRLLEREIGEVVDIEQLTREDSNWRGRAQKLEIYKQKLRKVKMQGTSMSSFAADDTLSVISETPSVFTGKITNAEKTLSQMGGNRAKELENVKRALSEREEEFAALKTKHAASLARNKTLDTQLRQIKGQFTQKMQILIEKTENDDRLITMLKSEVARLEQLKQVKSTLNSGMRLKPLSETDETTKLFGENGRLKNSVKCLEIELEQKEERIQLLMRDCVGAPDERIEETENRIAELEEKIEILERDKFRMQ